MLWELVCHFHISINMRGSKGAFSWHKNEPNISMPILMGRGQLLSMDHPWSRNWRNIWNNSSFQRECLMKMRKVLPQILSFLAIILSQCWLDAWCSFSQLFGFIAKEVCNSFCAYECLTLEDLYPVILLASNDPWAYFQSWFVGYMGIEGFLSIFYWRAEAEPPSRDVGCLFDEMVCNPL